MRNIIYILCCFLIIYSCIEDDSTFMDRTTSEITIKSLSDSIMVDFGQEINFSPEVEQTLKGMELKYEWGLIQDTIQIISKDKVLKYSFKKLGNFKLRLRVSNDHGSTFKFYSLFVKAAFNEGILVLSSDENHKGRISFMRPLSREEIELGLEEQFNTNAFSSVNPEFPLYDPTDIQKFGDELLVLSRGDNLLYKINAKTFDLYSIIDFKPEFPNIKPLAICCRDNTNIVNFLIHSKEEFFTSVDCKSDVPIPTSYFKDLPAADKYFLCNIGWSVSHNFFINYEHSRLYYVFNFSRAGACYKDYPDVDIINILMDKDRNIRMVVRDKKNTEQLLIYRGIGKNGYSPKDPIPNSTVYSCETNNNTLTRESIIETNKLYSCAFYTNKNMLYRWYYKDAKPELPKEPVITLDDGLEITCTSITSDNKQIYLGVYNSRANGMKGSVYIFDADEIDTTTGQLKLIKAYYNIADKPIKVFYKH